MKFGILKTDLVRKELSPRFGEYPDMFSRLFKSHIPDCEIATYDVQAGHYPDTPEEVDAFVITGCSASVYDDLEWIHRLNEFVLQLHRDRKKLIGICFGHQMVAHILGGRTERAAVGWNLGVQTFQLTEAGRAFTGGQESINLIVSHQDQVIIPATGSEVLAGNEICPIAMCRLGNHFLTLQGHPEFGKEYARELYKLREAQFSEDLFDRAMQSLEKPVYYPLLVKWLVEFVRT